MKKQDMEFIEAQLEDIPSDSGLRKYRAAWFKDALFKCPKHHSIKYAWEHCYLPLSGLWPTADCLECQKAKDAHQDAVRQREEFLKRRHDFQNKADSKSQNHHQKEKDCLCSSECQHKSVKEESENTRGVNLLESSLQISFCDGDNLAEVLSDCLAHLLKQKQDLTLFHCLKRMYLAIAILFLRRSFEIVVKVRVNH